MKENNGYSAPLVYKTIAILQAVAESQSQLGVSEISRQLELNKSTVFGITQALLDLKMLRQDDSSKKFRLGPALIQLGNQSMAGFSLRTVARPFLERLAQDFMETVFLCRVDEFGITIVEKVDSPEELRISSPQGTRVPFFAGAAAKAFLAFMDMSSQRRIIEKRELPAFTSKSIIEVEDFIAELHRVRQRGYALDFEEYKLGINGLGVPVFDPRGWLMAIIWMVGFSTSLTEEKMHRAALAAKDASEEITLLIGV